MLRRRSAVSSSPVAKRQTSARLFNATNPRSPRLISPSIWITMLRTIMIRSNVRRHRRHVVDLTTAASVSNTSPPLAHLAILFDGYCCVWDRDRHFRVTALSFPVLCVMQDEHTACGLGVGSAGYIGVGCATRGDQKFGLWYGRSAFAWNDTHGWSMQHMGIMR